MRDGVIILHGIFCTPWSQMLIAILAKYIRKQGFDVLNLGYPSTKHSIQEFPKIIHKEINDFTHTIKGKIHFVGFSMGGLLIRAYLNQYNLSNLGRVVMIGTPNHGSEVANFFKEWKVYKFLFGPAGQQLITEQTGFRHHFGQSDYEIGVIAGNKSWNILSWWLIKKPHDGKVSVDSTKLTQSTPHIVVASNHSFLPAHKQTLKNTVSFLQTGRFLE